MFALAIALAVPRCNANYYVILPRATSKHDPIKFFFFYRLALREKVIPDRGSSNKRRKKGKEEKKKRVDISFSFSFLWIQRSNRYGKYVALETNRFDAIFLDPFPPRNLENIDKVGIHFTRKVKCRDEDVSS